MMNKLAVFDGFTEKLAEIANHPDDYVHPETHHNHPSHPVNKKPSVASRMLKGFAKGTAAAGAAVGSGAFAVSSANAASKIHDGHQHLHALKAVAAKANPFSSTAQNTASEVFHHLGDLKDGAKMVGKGLMSQIGL